MKMLLLYSHRNYFVPRYMPTMSLYNIFAIYNLSPVPRSDLVANSVTTLAPHHLTDISKY